MTKATRQTIIFRLFFYICAVGFILAVNQFQKHMTGHWIEPLRTTITSLDEKALEAFLEMNRLITALDTAALGAMGFLLVNVPKTQRTASSLWFAFGSAVSIFLSLFFGYVVYLALLVMLESHVFNLDNPQIWWARQAHFYTFLLGVVLFGDFAFHHLKKEKEGVQG